MSLSSLHVPRGSLYGFIGPNGSGKTTTLRMIMNILLPDRGEIAVLGEQRHPHGPRPRELPARGARPLQEDDRPPSAPLLRRPQGHEGSPRSSASIGAWIERMNLSEWIDKKVDALSKGMAQKVQFIAAVVAGPELLILDEPFSGLDPVNARGPQGRRARPQEGGHDGRLLDARHGDGRAALRPDLHDLQGQEGAGRHARRDPGESTAPTRSACGPTDGLAALDGLAEVESVNDSGNVQEVRWDGDPQDLLRALMARTGRLSLRDHAAQPPRHLRPHRQPRAGGRDPWIRS